MVQPQPTQSPSAATTAAAGGYDTQAAPQSTSAAPEVAAERPSWLPERFQSGEDMARAYADLERQQQDGSPADQSAGASPASGDIPTNNADAQAMVESAGLAFDALNEEYMANGTLSARSYDDLARAGFDRSVVDGFIAGQQAIAQGIKNEVFDAAGGADAFADMVDWAKTAFNASDRAAFNSVMNSGQTHAMKLAVDGLRSRFIAENGSAPKLIGGRSGSGVGSGDAFTNTKQLTAAMSDDRYRTDKAYRDSVIAKLGRSSIL